MTPVAIPIAPEAKKVAAMTVASEAAPIFTILLPIKIVTRRRLGFCLRALICFARGSLFFTMVSIFASVSDMNATSDAEKNAERTSRRTRIRSSIVIGV